MRRERRIPEDPRQRAAEMRAGFDWSLGLWGVGGGGFWVKNETARAL